MDDLELQKVLARHIFSNPDAAAIHALNRISETGYELGGGIYKDAAGRYTATDPHQALAQELMRQPTDILRETK